MRGFRAFERGFVCLRGRDNICVFVNVDTNSRRQIGVVTIDVDVMGNG